MSADRFAEPILCSHGHAIFAGRRNRTPITCLLSTSDTKICRAFSSINRARTSQTMRTHLPRYNPSAGAKQTSNSADLSVNDGARFGHAYSDTRKCER
jgi:hypothetical protein